MNLFYMLVFIATLASCSSVKKVDSHKQNIIVKRVSLEKELKSLSHGAFELGGLSGLHKVRKISDDRYEMLALTDRGPNGKEISKDGKVYRQFNDPQFSPGIFSFELNLKTLEVNHFEFHPILTKSGKLTSGLPPDPKKTGNSEYEIPIFGEQFEKPLPFDNEGVDSESITTDNKGSVWIGEEYRPGILKLNPNFKTVMTIAPGAGPHDLSNQLKYRNLNRGFEGLAFANNKIYAILQSALHNPKKANEKDWSNQDLTRIVEFDIKSEKMTTQYLFPLDDPKKSKIGDLTALPDGSFLTIEQNGKKGKEGVHSIYRFKLDEEKKIPSKTAEPIESNGPVLNKQLVVSLEEIGINEFEKVEGLTWLNSNTLAIVNDNDFRVQGADASEDSELVIIQLPNEIFSSTVKK